MEWLVQDTFAPAIASHPGVSEVVAFPRKAFANWSSAATLRAIRGYLRGLREREYDLVLDCQGLARSGALAWATRSPRRVGYANAAELGWLGLTDRVHVPMDVHTVDRMLWVARAAGAQAGMPASAADMRLYSAGEDREHAVHTLGLAPGSYVVLAPTSRWPGKLWPAERFAEIARRVVAGGRRVVVVGASNEREQCAAVLEQCGTDGRVVDLLGQTSIGQLLAVIEGAGVVVANDSAALHMAVGFGRPLVALFGPTSVSRVGPYGRAADVLQHVGPGDDLNHKDAVAGRSLMERIGVEEVWERVKVAW